MNITSYLWDAKKKPGFWGSGGDCWGKETGIKVVNIAAIFSASKPQIPVGAKHDRRQIIAENINLNTAWASPYPGSVRKKTAVGVICGMRKRNPVSKFLGRAVGAKKPGFFCGYHELSVAARKKPGF
ncbi:hypothetical protein [Planktothricoides raciborskii]|uniref:Uncharacterized protein n=1 Tax=Planktothricoides raciborskii FACHB-1370 TaxID=2949576 RepID=A0ABR8EI36_9CYAN|nr:hypothetical protein [Planktothricoides raciborskii]MBD2545266.1 hypothetical protein [Planktothricoides raciborskii FACHB-1370]MBD2584417.1 hypothetical protein [Planktothricoides raciborskii FACHB-1261]